MVRQLRVLVTGSTGFIGSHLCQKLLKLGFNVVAFHRPTSPTLMIDKLPVEHKVGDITDKDSVHVAMSGIDVIYHCAAKLGKSSYAESYRITVEGTRNVLEAAIGSGIERIVHTSSVAALGVPIYINSNSSNQSKYLINENHSWNYPAEWWPYGYTKYLAEQQVQKSVAEGLDAVIVNPGLVIGPGDINFVAGDLIKRVANGQLKISTTGGLNAVHICDVVEGHLLALENGKTGERYILGNENLSHSSLIRTIADVSEVPYPALIIPGTFLNKVSTPMGVIDRIFPLPFSPHALRKLGTYFYYDTSKARNELGFEAKKSTKQAVIESINWYRNHNLI